MYDYRPASGKELRLYRHRCEASNKEDMEFVCTPAQHQCHNADQILSRDGRFTDLRSDEGSFSNVCENFKLWALNNILSPSGGGSNNQ